MSKFDGTGFINPNNTSFNQEPKNYQSPNFQTNQQNNLNQIKRKPKGGWDEEDEVKPNNDIKRQPSKKLDPEPSFKQHKVIDEPQKQNNFQHEAKILEDIIKLQGVNLKPTDILFSEFQKKLKSLNKQAVFKILQLKLDNSKENLDELKQMTVYIFKIRDFFM
jgi:hypothetical protein